MLIMHLLFLFPMRVFQVQTHLSVRISPPDQALVEMRTMRLQDVLAPDRPPPQRHGFDKLNPSQPTSYSYSDNHSGYTCLHCHSIYLHDAISL